MMAFIKRIIFFLFCIENHEPIKWHTPFSDKIAHLSRALIMMDYALFDEKILLGWLSVHKILANEWAASPKVPTPFH